MAPVGARPADKTESCVWLVHRCQPEERAADHWAELETVRPCRLEHLRLSAADRQPELLHSSLDQLQISTLRIIKHWVLKQCLGVGVEPHATLSKAL